MINGRNETRIVCAANRVKLSTEVSESTHSTHLMVVGARHWDSQMRMQAYRMAALNLIESPFSVEWEQGFMDQREKFHTREEAWKIAEAAGQILFRVGGDDTNGGTLYSENLY